MDTVSEIKKKYKIVNGILKFHSNNQEVGGAMTIQSKQEIAWVLAVGRLPAGVIYDASESGSLFIENLHDLVDEESLGVPEGVIRTAKGYATYIESGGQRPSLVFQELRDAVEHKVCLEKIHHSVAPLSESSASAWLKAWRIITGEAV